MFDQSVRRVGFACKINSSPGVAAGGQIAKLIQ